MDKELVLLGSSIPLPEVDPEENERREINAFKKYISMDIIDNMGKEGFEMIYKSSLDTINQMSRNDKYLLCREILKKTKELYNYEFPFKLDLTEPLIFDEVFIFLEYLEYDYIDCFAEVWKNLGIDLRLIDIEGFVNNNIEQIIVQIDSHLDTIVYCELFNLFLGTINKEDLIKYMIVKTQNAKMDIVLKIMEGEVNDNNK